MYEPSAPEDGASSWRLPLSSSERCREDHWEAQYVSAFQNLNLREQSPYQTHIVNTGERKPVISNNHRSRSSLAQSGVSPPTGVSLSTYISTSHPLNSRAEPAASYSSVSYSSESRKPHNVPVFRPRSARMSYPSTRNQYPPPTWSMNEPKFVPQPRSQQYLHNQSWRRCNPLTPESDTSSWSSDDDVSLLDEVWPQDYISDSDLY